MTTDARTIARTRLERILSDSARQADRLRLALRTERAALEANDADALDAATAAKADPLATLTALEADRAAAVRSAGFDTDAGAMDEIIGWCDEGQVLANGWRGLLGVARDCDRLNATNGAIIRLRRQQAMARLTVLRGSEFDGGTYAAPGIETHSPGGRALAQA